MIDEVFSCDHSAAAWPEQIEDRDLERTAELFRALGDPARLRLLERLYRAERCVSDLAQEMEEGLSTVSQRLKVLRAEGLVNRRRDGKHIFYCLADDHVINLLANALAHATEPH